MLAYLGLFSESPPVRGQGINSQSLSLRGQGREAFALNLSLFSLTPLLTPQRLEQDQNQRVAAFDKALEVQSDARGQMITDFLSYTCRQTHAHGLLTFAQAAIEAERQQWEAMRATETARLTDEISQLKAAADKASTHPLMDPRSRLSCCKAYKRPDRDCEPGRDRRGCGC
jgi:hypothetical protein